MWNLENDTDDLICQTELWTQNQRTNLGTPRREKKVWDEFGEWDYYI